MMDLSIGRVVHLPDALAKDPGRDDYESARDDISEAVLSRGAAKDGLTMAK